MPGKTRIKHFNRADEFVGYREVEEQVCPYCGGPADPWYVCHPRHRIGGTSGLVYYFGCKTCDIVMIRRTLPIGKARDATLEKQLGRH